MYYDFNTKNESFKQMRYKLQDAGVENCMFMLQTINKELVGIDIIEKIHSAPKNDINRWYDMILTECKENIWYFFREVVRIPNNNDVFSTYEASSRFTLNMINMEMIFCYEHNISILAESPRQTGRGLTINCLKIYSMLKTLGTAQFYFTSHSLTSLYHDISIRINILHCISEVIPSAINYIESEKPDLSKTQIHTGKSLSESNRFLMSIDRLPVVEVQKIETNLFSDDSEYNKDLMRIFTLADKFDHVILSSTHNKAIEPNLLLYMMYLMPKIEMYSLFDMTLPNIKKMKEHSGVYLLSRNINELGLTDHYIQTMKAILPEDVYEREVELKR